jgi:hypothetical protein
VVCVCSARVNVQAEEEKQAALRGERLKRSMVSNVEADVR